MNEAAAIAAIEAALYRHPSVREGCAVPVPGAAGAVELRAYVSLRPGAAATPAELLAHCESLLEPEHRPRSVTVLPELPRTRLGKIARLALIQRG